MKMSREQEIAGYLARLTSLLSTGFIGCKVECSSGTPAKVGDTVTFMITGLERIIYCDINSEKASFNIYDKAMSGYYTGEIKCNDIKKETIGLAQEVCIRFVDDAVNAYDEYTLNKKAIIKNGALVNGDNKTKVQSKKSSLVDRIAKTIFTGYGLKSDKIHTIADNSEGGFIDKYYNLKELMFTYDGEAARVGITYDTDAETMYLVIGTASSDAVAEHAIYSLDENAIKQGIRDFVQMTKAHVNK